MQKQMQKQSGCATSAIIDVTNLKLIRYGYY